MSAPRGHRSGETSGPCGTRGTGGGTVLAGALVSAPLATAEPRRSLAEVEAQVTALQDQAEQAAERYNGARIRLGDVERRLTTLRARVSDQEKALGRVQRTVGQFARVTYTSGGVDVSLQLLLADDPQDFLARAATLDQVARTQATALRRSQTARLRLAQSQAAVQQEEQAAAAVRDEMSAAMSEADAHLAEAEQVLSTLQEAERQRLEAIAKARREAAMREAAAAAAAASAAASGSTRDESTASQPAASPATGGQDAGDSGAAPATPVEDPSPPSQDAGGSQQGPGDPGQDAGDSGQGSGASQGAGGSGASDGSSSGGDVSDRASAAVQYALAQVGDSYVAGASGPSAFDCSGLTSAAWAAAGVSLPHYSYSQWDVTRRVSSSEAQPGDLVFYFGGGAHHVGLYIGGGRMVHAANPSRGVLISDIFGPWYGERFSGIGRVVG